MKRDFNKLRIMKCNRCPKEVMTRWIPDLDPCLCGGRWRTREPRCN